MNYNRITQEEIDKLPQLDRERMNKLYSEYFKQTPIKTEVRKRK